MMTDTNRPKSPRRARIALASLLATTMLAGGGLFASRAWSANDNAAAAPAPVTAPLVNQAGFADLAAKVKSAVVNIATTEQIERTSAQEVPGLPPGSPLAELFGRHSATPGGESRHALGSGFIIDPAGYIVTNNHVVDHARKVVVTLDDGSSYTATVKGRDAKTDLALLKIDAGKQLPFVSFGDSDQARVGDWIVAVGNPFGLGGTVTAGIVSAHGRNLDDGPYDDFLQTDAAINPGNSGGPLFNQSGQVIGIDTAILSPHGGGSVGIGFAIPSNLATKIVAQLREHGTVERGWLGVQMQPLSPALAKAIGRPNTDGVLVDQVQPDSPAARADLQVGDVITGFAGAPVKNPRELALAVANQHEGAAAQLTIWREGQARSLALTVGTQAPEHTAAQAAPSDGTPVGMALAPLTKEARDQLGLGDTAKGVVVAQVTPGSRAAESGVQPGDVIVKIGSEPVATPSEAIARIHAAEHDKKEAVPLLVMRDGTTYYLALELRAA
jgi:serine protease Do